MKTRKPAGNSLVIWLLTATLAVSACQPMAGSVLPASGEAAAPAGASGQAILVDAQSPEPTPTPWFGERPRYGPAQLVDYTAQSGDTLPGLAVRFNTTVEEILQANSFIPRTATTMPPGMPMKIPIYYLPLWGSPYQVLPDSLFPNGPAQVGFDVQGYVAGTVGWLNGYTDYVSDANRTGAQIVEYVAAKYSISPRLLLALLEYQSGALSKPTPPEGLEDFPLGERSWNHKGLFLQLGWAANRLNDAYYRYRQSTLIEFEHKDGTLERIDPWQNAATVTLMSYFNELYSYPEYLHAISPDGFVKTYTRLFGDPWQNVQPHIPGSLVQPAFILPFEPGYRWAMTGGPHTGWGNNTEPLAAIDFAPPSKTQGCVHSDVWATAVADGVVVRSEIGEVMIDLDGDGDERTGWNVYYLHVGSDGRVPLGTHLRQGDRIGHPSCEGGSATGTHIHMARKYNGEWLPAQGWGESILAFNLEGWVAHNGRAAYYGTLVRNGQSVVSCTCSNQRSWVWSDRPVPPGANPLVPQVFPTPYHPGGEN